MDICERTTDLAPRLLAPLVRERLRRQSPSCTMEASGSSRCLSVHLSLPEG